MRQITFIIIQDLQELLQHPSMALKEKEEVIKSQYLNFEK
jgi:hypothetical protein